MTSQITNQDKHSISLDFPYTALTNGTWSQKWAAAQTPGLPKHLINHVTDHFECTCGYRPRDMKDWSRHATTSRDETNRDVMSPIEAPKGNEK